MFKAALYSGNAVFNRMTSSYLFKDSVAAGLGSKAEAVVCAEGFSLT